MRFVLSCLMVAGIALPAALFGQSEEKHGDKEVKQDIRRHRALAALHEATAKCLEAGKGEKVCLEQLRQDCKGLGIGKYCGMRHQH
jgi:hypothetical protein